MAAYAKTKVGYRDMVALTAMPTVAVSTLSAFGTLYGYLGALCGVAGALNITGTDPHSISVLRHLSQLKPLRLSQAARRLAASIRFSLRVFVRRTVGTTELCGCSVRNHQLSIGTIVLTWP